MLRTMIINFSRTKLIRIGKTMGIQQSRKMKLRMEDFESRKKEIQKKRKLKFRAESIKEIDVWGKNAGCLEEKNK